MKKKVVIVFLFVLLFAGAWGVMYKMTPREEAGKGGTLESGAFDGKVYSYNAADIASGCQTKDEIFCAIEQTVKCTMAPELDGCLKDRVPSFVLGKTEEAVRPTEMSFKIVKIKPIPQSSDISVYTESECNAMWFGLCKGTVIYSLSQRNGKWAVVNIYAME